MGFSRSQGRLTRILTQILRFQDADFPLSNRINMVIQFEGASTTIRSGRA